MFNRIVYFIISIYAFIYSVSFFLTKNVSIGLKHFNYINMGYFYIIAGILMGVMCVFFGYLAFRPKTHIKPYIDPDKGVKCPKCKKSYNYKDTNKGKCPTCNIDTIDIDDYYKKFPKELKDAGK